MAPDTDTRAHQQHQQLVEGKAEGIQGKAYLDLLSEEEEKYSAIQIQIQYVRVTWVDLTNCVRYRIVPIRYFRRLFANININTGASSVQYHIREREREREKVSTQYNPINIQYNPTPGLTLTKASLGLVNLALADGFSAVGEYVYAPDLASARLLPYAPGHANVFGWFEEKQVEVEIGDGDGDGDVKARARRVGEDGDGAGGVFGVALCPRSILRRVVDDAFKKEGISFLVGFETEVIFLSSIDPIKAVNDYGWSESPAILAGTAEARALEEIAVALEGAGIELQMYHAEAAPGQFEIVTGPLPPLQACDALITTREIIVNVAAKHGMRATLAPRVYSNSCGSAAHAHISLTSSSLHSSQNTLWSSPPQPTPVSAPPSVSLTPLEQSFLAGLLEHLPAATAFTLPTRASYARMVDGVWSGGTWASWGRDNREAPIRLAGRAPSSHSTSDSGLGLGSGYNFEIKSIDGTANPYLAISALLSAGLSGVKSRQPLKTTGLHVPANLLSEKERREYGVVKRMPLTIDEARNALIGDGVLRDALGEEFVKVYLNVNKTLDEQLRAPTPQEEMLKLIKAF